ncbi:MAG: sensor histidine kinase, partial [Primorskyibacter sp.]
GRLLLLTTIFVILAQVVIFLPSVAYFRTDYLQERLERAQIASLALQADDMISFELEEELLRNAGVFNVVLRSDAGRQLVLSAPLPGPLTASYDLRQDAPLILIRDALLRFADPAPQVIRVIGEPVLGNGQVIEVTLNAAPLRGAMLDYGLEVLVVTTVISIVTGALLFITAQRLLVAPIRGVVGHMQAYAKDPEDARRIITPQASMTEMREAEEALLYLQTELTQALKQRERLAQLGAAVARVSHDLRNILTSAQLFTDRIEGSEDPTVRRLAPKLVRSITRAVTLCESTLAFGRAEEQPPQISRFALSDVVDEVFTGERLAIEDAPVTFVDEVPPRLMIEADPEQLFRSLQNIVRNGRQAIVGTGDPGEICIRAMAQDTAWIIEVADTGPGLPPKARDNLFKAFQGNARKGGTGLGLAIVSELIRGHGGTVELAKTDEEGTTFRITLPMS